MIGISSASIPKRVREAVYARDGRRCVYCNTEHGPFHLDHVMPRSRGGPNSLKNLVVACVRCNVVKKDRTPEEMGWEFGGVSHSEPALPEPRVANYMGYLSPKEVDAMADIDAQLSVLNTTQARDRAALSKIMMRCIRRMRREKGLN